MKQGDFIGVTFLVIGIDRFHGRNLAIAVFLNLGGDNINAMVRG
jgi:hypothetical protein